MRLRVGYLCHLGKVRENNEDGIVIHSQFIRDEEGWVEVELGEKPMLVAVADGVGGIEAGEVASEIVLKTLAEASISSPETLVETLRECQRRLASEASIRENSQMASTVAGIVFRHGSALIFNVGDSRVYGERFGYLVRLSKDHSLVEQLIDTGYITPEEVRSHPQRHIITSAISTGDEDFEVFTREIPVKEGDRFLICSDGLWEMLAEEELEACWKGDDPLSLCFEKAMEHGGRDNISIIIVKVLTEE